MERVKLHWLAKIPEIQIGTTWGIPWPKGVLERTACLKLEDEYGRCFPMQSWPIAYWPDGSVKWTAHAASFSARVPNTLFISQGQQADIASDFMPLAIEEHEEYIEIDTGRMICDINRTGSRIIRTIRCGNVTEGKLFKCLSFFKGHPYTFISSGVYGYDPETTQLYEFELLGGDHFMFCFGSQMVWMEIFQAIGDQELNELLMDLGQYYTPFVEDKETKLRQWNVKNEKFTLSVYNSGLAAYAAKNRKIDELARAVWDVLLNDNEKSWIKFPVKSHEVLCEQYIKPVVEIPWISTNAVSQWSLNTIMCLELIGDKIPKEYVEKYS